jgi:hypothetical protein
VFSEFELGKLQKMCSEIFTQGEKLNFFLGGGGGGGGKSHREEKLSNTGLMDRPGSRAHLDCSTLNSVSLQTRVLYPYPTFRNLLLHHRCGRVTTETRHHGAYAQ